LEELHPKPAHAAKLVSQQLNESPDSKVLIFTEYRDTVELLTEKLNSIEGVVADRFIGQSGTGSRKGMNQKQQLAQLQRFREGDINVLIATSVGEEGLDVPAADLVILYEPVPSAIRTIQRRGRTARQRDGEVHILITKDTRDVFVYRASKLREEKMYTLLDRIKTRGRMIFKEPPKDVLSDFSVIDGDGVDMSAVEFLAAEKIRLEKLFPMIETVIPDVVTEKEDEVKSDAGGVPIISPAMRRPSNQMGLESFIGNSENEPQTNSDEDEKSSEDKQLKPKWNVILDGTKQQLNDD
jgi:Fanconi anemia group M protein